MARAHHRTHGVTKDINIHFDLTVRASVSYGVYTNEMFGGWQSPQGVGHSWMVPDNLDYDLDGNTTELIAKDNSNVTVGADPGSVAGVEAVKWVKGELDSGYSKFPATASTVLGGNADYRLVVRNTGQIQMKDIVLIDILPHVGDTGVIDTSARGSQWQPVLAGAVSGGSGISVYYSTASNPCRDELTPGIPAGCDAPNWQTSPPSDITTVRALKFDFGSKTLFVGEEVVIEWPMRAPVTAPTNGEIAWNSFGFVATRADDNVQLLPAEPVKVGVAIVSADPGVYGDLVWLDSNSDGMQTPGESGVDGVRIDLYRDNGDGIAQPSVDTLEDFTVTSGGGFYLFTNLDPDDYFAVVHYPRMFGLAPKDQGSDESLDSDADIIDHGGTVVAVMPITHIDTVIEQRHWDVGLIDRTGLPAVWALRELGDGRLLIGGKFATAHSVSRSGIAILAPDGSVDTTFDPGSGFNGPVRSLDVRADGKIIAAGGFSVFDGHPANGLALINPDGSWAGTYLQPAGGSVISVLGGGSGTTFLAGGFDAVAGFSSPGIVKVTDAGGVDTSFVSGLPVGSVVHVMLPLAGGQMIIGGEFASYAGQPCQNIICVDAGGNRATGFNASTGASGPVKALFIQDDGKIVASGNFSSYTATVGATSTTVSVDGVVRINPDGTLDSSLNSTTNLSISEINTSN